MYSSTLSLTTALDGVCDQRHALADLPPGKTRYQIYRRLGGPQAWSGMLRKMSPTGIRSPDRLSRSEWYKKYRKSVFDLLKNWLYKTVYSDIAFSSFSLAISRDRQNEFVRNVIDHDGDFILSVTDNVHSPIHVGSWEYSSWLDVCPYRRFLRHGVSSTVRYADKLLTHLLRSCVHWFFHDLWILERLYKQRTDTVLDIRVTFLWPGVFIYQCVLQLTTTVVPICARDARHSC
jgi:hypothetical protein